MALRHTGLPDSYTDDVTDYTGAEIERVHGVLDTQPFGALQVLGAGVAAIPDAAAFEVTAGSGLTVNIANGAGIAPHSVLDAVFLQTRASTPLTGLDASSTLYIHATIETSVDNDSREKGTPLFMASASETLDGGLLLAEVTTGASGVTAVIDRREFISIGSGEGGGSSWHTDTGVPDSELGADGDFYINAANGDYYEKTGGAWELAGNLRGLAGAAGAQGIQGEPGEPGADGEDGGTVSTLGRTDAVATTSTLAYEATENLTIALGRISLLIRVSTSHAARVRIYRTLAQRTADAARPIGTRPTGNHGLIFEGVTTVGTLVIDVLRELLAVNAEAPPVADMPIAVTNLSGGSQAVTVTVNTSTVQD